MHAICNVIYGIPLYLGTRWYTRTDKLTTFLDTKPPGVLTYDWATSGILPAAFGVHLGEFDTRLHHLELTDVAFTPTPAQLATYQGLYAALSVELQQELMPFGEARVFILWSRS